MEKKKEKIKGNSETEVKVREEMIHGRKKASTRANNAGSA
jgi:hypothetical protein